MRYSIFCILKGDFARYQQRLYKEYAKRFNEPYMLEHPLPCHITLKAPFELEDIGLIEEIVKKVCENHRASKMRIRKIGNFNRKVVFFKPELSKDAKKAHKELIKGLKKVKGLKWGAYEPDFKYHSTLVYGNTPENFRRIWKEASKLKPDFEPKFDNMTIMKEVRGRTIVHKTFKLGKK